MDSYSFGSSFFRLRPYPSAKGMPQLAPVDTTVDVFYHRPISEILKPVLEKGSFWQDIVGHPNYDDYWQTHCSTHDMKSIKPAVMIVGGLYDAEDNYGTWNTWRQIRQQSPKTPLYLVEAPWYHHAWGNSNYQHLDGAWFGAGTAAYFINQIEYPFFAYYLEGKGQKPAPVTLLPSAETSEKIMKNRNVEKQWLHLDCWPPKESQFIRLKLGGGTVISDPRDPVPYYSNLKIRHRDRSYMAADQRFATKRSDVLTYRCEALKDTLRLMGPIRVHLELNTTATDLDAVVKIIDIRPDGYEMLVRGDVMPARFRHSLTTPEPVLPGKDFTLSFTMPDIAHILLPGHRLMIQVQYSCYPLVTVNPQTFLTNPYTATNEDYRKAQVTLLGNGKSWVNLSVW
jgi:putative CocE/NonD family hydrolase